jgi:hypothetical protein
VTCERKGKAAGLSPRVVRGWWVRCVGALRAPQGRRGDGGVHEDRSGGVRRRAGERREARASEQEGKAGPSCASGVAARRVGWGGWRVLLITIPSAHSPSEVGEG